METALSATYNRKAGRKEWIGLAVLALPALLVSMDMTVIYLAVPAITASLKPGSAQLLWITDIFGFMEAGFLISMGTLGDRIGRKKLLLTGAILFTLASVLTAFAATASMLIAARALLGITGATLLPSTLSLIRNLFHDDKQRTFAIGIWTTCFSAGTMLGPFAGGYLLTHFWWGSVFLMGVPVMILLLVLAPRLLPESRSQEAGRFDLPSVGLLIIATLSVVYGIKCMAEDGVTWLPFVAIISGLILGVFFLRRQKELNSPLIDLSLFRVPAWNAALGALMVSLFSWTGMLLLVTQYLQLVLDINPFRAGLLTMPGSLSSVVFCMLAPVLARKTGRKQGIVAGLLTLAAGIASLAFTEINSGITITIIATILISAGCGTVVTLGTDFVIGGVPTDRVGSAAGISETSTTLGSALGVALLGSIWTAGYRHAMFSVSVGQVDAVQADIVRNTLGGALAVAKQLPHREAALLIGTARNAFVSSFHITTLVCTGIVILTAVVVWKALRINRES
ncbi:MAG: MFS transporter [Chitinophagaceae bacterium]